MIVVVVLPGNASVHQQLEAHDADREDVGAGIDRLAEELLRRHVPGRADDRRHALRQAVDDLGDAEIEDLEPAARLSIIKLLGLMSRWTTSSL